MHLSSIHCICHILILDIFKIYSKHIVYDTEEKIISNTIIDTQIKSINTLTSIYIHHGIYELI